MQANRSQTLWQISRLLATESYLKWMNRHKQTISEHRTPILEPGFRWIWGKLFPNFLVYFCSTHPLAQKLRNFVTILVELSGMFRRSASLVILHLRSVAMIPCVSLVLLGTRSQLFVVTRIAAANCTYFGTFKTNSWLPTGRSWGKQQAFVS